MVDQLFVVNGVTQLRRSKVQKTWLTFPDLKKGFPSVWHERLWENEEIRARWEISAGVPKHLRENTGKGTGWGISHGKF